MFAQRLLQLLLLAYLWGLGSPFRCSCSSSITSSSSSTNVISRRSLNMASVTTSLTPVNREGASFAPNPNAVPASAKTMTMVSLLVDLWEKIAFPTDDDTESVFVLSNYGLARKDVKGFLKHFQTCKDCAGDGAFLMATKDDETEEDVLQLSNVYFPLAVEDEDAELWGQFDRSLLIGADGKEEEPPPLPFPIEHDDETILRDTKEWVKKVIADFGVCPFTVDPDRAGIPIGGVRYTISRAQSPEEAFLRYWQEVQALLSTTERDMSTVLLVFPELELFGNFELFEQYCESLADGLCASSMCFEDDIQLVFFHPKYNFRDGQARSSSESGAANFARRGPWPMINILRTQQVTAAQKGIPTGQVYKQNEERLAAVGTEVLERMLYDRNWRDLPTHAKQSKAIRAEAHAAVEQATGGTIAAATAAMIAADANALAAAAAAAGVCPFIPPASAPVAADVAVAAVAPAVNAQKSQQQQQQQQQQKTKQQQQQQPQQKQQKPPPQKQQQPQQKKQAAAAAGESLSRLMKDTSKDKGEIDYVKLAEEAERWLAEG